ncbi:MAG: acyl--CoA ligase [Thermodesulfobacteriaceae bacterium]|nr:acyl--CoA ligase [Thermodesulfobacteriaceae bacterium]
MITIYQVFKKVAESLREKVFLIEEDKSFTFGKVLEMVENWAYYLSEKVGIKRGDKVCLLMNNQIEFPLSLLALNKIGAIFVPLNNRLTPREIEFMVRASNSKVVLLNPLFEEKVKNLEGVTTLEASTVRNLKEGGNTPTLTEEEAFILFTSGTTGLPKGVLHTNENGLFYAKVMIDGLGFEREMKQLIVAPLYHAIGFIDQLLPAMILGETVVLSNDTTPQGIANLMEKYQIDILLGVPTIFTLLLLSGVAKKFDFSQAKIFGYAGAPMSSKTIQGLKKTFPHIKLYNFYGSTEVGGTITILEDKYALSHADTVGKEVEGVEVKILKDGEFVRGEIGEVVTAPRYMKGYINADTKKAFYGNYLRMGDLGSLDQEGFLTLYGRIDDMIIVHGENVYPIEIERAVIESGVVKEVAVVGKETILGSQLVCFVSLIGGLNEKEALEKIKEVCKEKLADFKRPREFVVLEELPKNPVGKIDKKKLSEMAKS